MRVILATLALYLDRHLCATLELITIGLTAVMGFLLLLSSGRPGQFLKTPEQRIAAVGGLLGPVIRSVRSLLAVLRSPSPVPIAGHRLLCRLEDSGWHVAGDACLHPCTQKCQGSAKCVGCSLSSIQSCCHPRLLDRPSYSRAYFPLLGHGTAHWNVAPLWRPSLDREP
jgi:hypothetical protein